MAKRSGWRRAGRATLGVSTFGLSIGLEKLSKLGDEDEETPVPTSPPGGSWDVDVTHDVTLDLRETFGKRAATNYPLIDGMEGLQDTRFHTVITAGGSTIALAEGFMIFKGLSAPDGFNQRSPDWPAVTAGLVDYQNVHYLDDCRWVDRRSDRRLLVFGFTNYVKPSGNTKRSSTKQDERNKTVGMLFGVLEYSPSGKKMSQLLQPLLDAAPQVFVNPKIGTRTLVAGVHWEFLARVALYGWEYRHSTQHKVVGMLLTLDHGRETLEVRQCGKVSNKVSNRDGGWPRGEAPRAGFIANSHEFEKFMAKWMQWLGWDDASVMPKGPDGGVDVTAKGAKGQAKYWDHSVGIEEVQRHNGVCEGIPKHGRVFLAKNGYTNQALQWAETHDLPLFEMKAGSKDAQVAASTNMAQKLLKVGAKAL